MPSRADVFARTQWNLKILADTRRDGVDFYPRGKDERWWILNVHGSSHCHTRSEHDPHEIWGWRNVELADGNHVPLARLMSLDTETPTDRAARLLLNPNSPPPLHRLRVRIEQRHRELDLATMKLKTTRLDHDDRARIELAQRIADGLESPFCDKAIDLKIDQHWMSDWVDVIFAWATRTKAAIEDITTRPDSVSQLDKFRAGWVLWWSDDSDTITFADFDKFMKASVDMSVLNKTERPWSYRRPDKAIAVPLKTTAESTFSWIRDATTAWENNRRLVTGDLLGSKFEVTRDGRIESMGEDTRLWRWRVADYDPTTTTIATAEARSTYLNPFIHHNVKLDLVTLRVDTVFTDAESNMIRSASHAWHGKITPFSAKSVESDLRNNCLPERWEQILGRAVDRAKAVGERGDYLREDYTIEDRIYIGWKLDNPGLDFAAFDALDTLPAAENPVWEEWRVLHDDKVTSTRNKATLLDHGVFDDALGVQRTGGRTLSTLDNSDGNRWTWSLDDYDSGTAVIDKIWIFSDTGFLLCRHNVTLNLVTMRVETTLTDEERRNFDVVRDLAAGTLSPFSPQVQAIRDTMVTDEAYGNALRKLGIRAHDRSIRRVVRSHHYTSDERAFIGWWWRYGQRMENSRLLSAFERGRGDDSFAGRMWTEWDARTDEKRGKRLKSQPTTGGVKRANPDSSPDSENKHSRSGARLVYV